jgi:hypothetical protein
MTAPCTWCDGSGSLDCRCAPPDATESAPRRPEPPPWPAWVGDALAAYERGEGQLPEGTRECQCGTGEVETPEGNAPCVACGGWLFLWDAPEGAGGAST